MKITRLLPFFLSASLALWCGCSSDLELSGNPEHVGADEAAVAVSIQFPGGGQSAPKSYAPGDVGDEVLPGVSLDTEKEIKSLAFVNFTAGGTSVYLSTENTLTDNGFTKALAPHEDGVAGHYIASFKIKSADFSGKTTIVAVANFKEYGFTLDDFKNLTTPAELKDKATAALAADGTGTMTFPLLMTTVVEQEIVEGSTVSLDFKMERIMARVDVVNNAHKDAAGNDLFVLASARLVSAASQGFLIGGTKESPAYIDMAVQDKVTTVAADPDNGITAKQTLAPMYAYENSNADKVNNTQLSATATYIEVKGIYKGQTYEKRIPFLTPKKLVGGVVTGGEIIPIARNTRYLLDINPTPDAADLNFGVKIAEWQDGGQIDVEGDYPAPKLEGLDGFVPGAGATWAALTNTLNITNATAASTFNLTIRGNQDSDFYIEKEYDENKTLLSESIKVERNELQGYADDEVGSLSRTYTVTVPPVTDGEYPSGARIVFYNASNDQAQTVINVKYSPFVTILNKASLPANAIIVPATKSINLTDVAAGTSGEVSFFVASASEEEVTVQSANKGASSDFYTVTETSSADNAALMKKYGPGKLVKVAYKALSSKPEIAEITLKEGAQAEKKIFVGSAKSGFGVVTSISENNNTLVDGTSVYLAINNGDHGSIAYMIASKVETVPVNPTFKYASDAYLGSYPAAKGDWMKGITPSSIGSETFADLGIILHKFSIALPNVMKNPDEATMSFSDNSALKLIPVYPANGSKLIAADKVMKPVVKKGVWFAPVNIGQKVLATVGMTCAAAGNLFQWGRKQALTYDSPTVAGPLALNHADVTSDKFITTPTSPYDWLSTKTDNLWNAGTDDSPVKVSANDPCPAGWRVPSKIELEKLLGSHTWAKASSPGASSCGLLTVTGDNSGQKLFFPAAGRRINDGSVSNQGSLGYYWPSVPNGADAFGMVFNSALVSGFTTSRGCGMFVRCVQD